MKSRLRWATKTSVASGGAHACRRYGERQLAHIGVALALQPGGRVEARAHVLQRDHLGQLDHGRRPELLDQARHHLVGDGQRRDRHRLGVLQDVALQRREHVGLAPPRHLADLGQVEAVVVRHEVAEVEAPAAADHAGAGQLGVGLEVRVERVPLLDLALEADITALSTGLWWK